MHDWDRMLTRNRRRRTGAGGESYRVLPRLSMCVLFSVLLLSLRTDARVSVNVPIDHWSYSFIERFEARGALSGLADGIKPFSRNRMARSLVKIAAYRDAAESELSAVESALLDRLLIEFEHEVDELDGHHRHSHGRIPEGTPPGWVGHVVEGARAGQGLFRYAREQGELRGDLLLRQQSDWLSGRNRSDTERIYRTRVGAVVRGHMGGKLAYRMSFEQTQERGSRLYFRRDDVFERRRELTQLKGSRADYHEGTAYAVFGFHFLNVELGKGEVRWGPAPEENLGLNNVAPSFDMLRLRTRLGAVELVSIAGALRPCPDRPDSPTCEGGGDSSATYIVNGVSRRLERDKYLAAHRLEASLTPWLDVGFQEVLVYGDRGPTVTYLNPLMFYWAAQSYQGDKDNLMMGVDVDLHGGGKRLYLAYVVDDLKKLRVFSDDFANKFSLQAGALVVDPLGLDDSDLRLEYVRIEPWIYTHRFPINTFRHFDAPLGHSLGPNSDRWQVQMDHRPHRDLSLRLHLGRARHGYNQLLEDGSIRNVGGDLHLGSSPTDNRENKKFLDGDVERRTELGGSFTMRPWTLFSVTAGYSHEWGKNVPLAPRWGEGIRLQDRTGFGDSNQHRVHLELRYGHL